MLLVSHVTFVPLSPCQPGVWNRVTLPSAPQSEKLATEEQRQKGGLWTWNDSPTLKCKTLLPQHGAGLLPPLICRKWLESETMSLTPSLQTLKLAQHAVSGQSGREAALNSRISQGKAGFCLFLLQQAITKQWGVNSSPLPPCVPKVCPLVIDTHFNAIPQAVTFKFWGTAGSAERRSKIYMVEKFHTKNNPVFLCLVKRQTTYKLFLNMGKHFNVCFHVCTISLMLKLHLSGQAPKFCNCPLFRMPHGSKLL